MTYKDCIKGKDNVRRTISLPKKLDDEMTKHDEVNWSMVARKAFEKMLEEIKSR